MEKKIMENHIHAAIFCSPHNPTGRVWEQWEIEKAMEIYKKHDVYVVSDEIWSDLLLNGHKHTPTQSVSEDAKQRTVALYAPSKTFNLAGLIGSYHIIYNDWLRERILKESSLSHYNSMNLLSMYALIGAYKLEGYEWVDELKEVLSGNVNYACDYIEKHFEGVNVSKPEGTYMLFLDCTEWCKKHGKTITELQAAGKDPFQITKYDVTAHSEDVKADYAEWEGKEVSIAGRMMSKRVMGKHLSVMCRITGKYPVLCSKRQYRRRRI